MRYALELSVDCEWTDEEIKEYGFDLMRYFYGKRLVIYKPLNNKMINVDNIPFWGYVKTIEAFNELEQIEGQLKIGDFI